MYEQAVPDLSAHNNRTLHHEKTLPSGSGGAAFLIRQSKYLLLRMQDIEKRNVNCIIVKDLSRFGRNYIETGRYLERIFPFMGVRFIAINDHYDSAEENDDKGRILIPFNYNIVADLGEIQNLTVQAAGIGNNLNQIARYFHSGGLASRGMLEELKKVHVWLFIPN